MAPAQGRSGEGRPRAKTMTERADEAAGVQRRLKEEAAQRREAAAAGKGSQTSGRGGGLSAHGRRRTP
jgi:hypothetical protein